MKQLVEHIRIATLTTDQIQKALTDQRKQANVEQQLEHVQKCEQDGSQIQNALLNRPLTANLLAIGL